MTYTEDYFRQKEISRSLAALVVTGLIVLFYTTYHWGDWGYFVTGLYLLITGAGVFQKFKKHGKTDKYN